MQGFFCDTLIFLKGPIISYPPKCIQFTDQGVLMQNLEQIPSRLSFRPCRFLKGCSNKVEGFQPSHHTPPGIILGWSLCIVLCSLRNVPCMYRPMLLQRACWQKRRYGDLLKRLISEHESKLLGHYNAILASVIKLVLYMRYINRSWPVKISEVSRENQSLGLTLEKMCNLLRSG